MLKISSFEVGSDYTRGIPESPECLYEKIKINDQPIKKSYPAHTAHRIYDFFIATCGAWQQIRMCATLSVTSDTVT
jgi:hypothetical protein